MTPDSSTCEFQPDPTALRARIDALPDGNIYLRPDGATPDGGDLRIDRRALPRDALHGDWVEFSMDPPKKPGGRPRVRVLRVVGRAPEEFEGHLTRRGRHLFVNPDDAFSQRSIWVDPSSIKGAAVGMRVRARLKPFNPDDPRPEAEILEVLGGDTSVERALKAIVVEKGIPTEFPPGVVRAAEALRAATVAGDRDGEWLDLRGEVMVTIDGASAKDFDDAVCVTADKNGFTAVVAVADVSRYVREGEPLDGEAIRRATSVYFPGSVFPMLPERLSNDLCSLVPNADRPVVGLRLRFDREGNRREAELFRGWICSRARLTYGQVNALLEDNDEAVAAELPAPVKKMLGALGDLARLRIARRRERGALDFDLPEPEFVLGLSGEVSEILHFDRRIAHRAIEELMISANEAAAEILAAAGLPVLYRCHAEPPPDKVEFFRRFAHNLGLKFPRRATPEAFQDVVAAAAGTPLERSVNVLVLRTMSMADYRVENVGHFGLAVRDYCHFTSPIRRYPDLINHRWARRYLERGGLSSTKAAEAKARLAELAPLLTERERNAEQAERAFIRVLKARFLQNKIGERFRAVVSGIAKFGVFVELQEYRIEGLISVRDLAGDYFVFDEERMEMRGRQSHVRFRLGDQVDVELMSVAVDKGFIDFRLLAHHPLSYGRN